MIGCQSRLGFIRPGPLFTPWRSLGSGGWLPKSGTGGFLTGWANGFWPLYAVLEVATLTAVASEDRARPN
jgi:hypothetical protein